MFLSNTKEPKETKTIISMIMVHTQNSLMYNASLANQNQL